MTADKLENKNSFWGWLGVLLIVGFVWYVVDWGFLTGSVTEYTVWCDEEFPGNGCHTLGNSTTYRPNKKTQTVISQDDWGIETLENCTVINRTNWQCTYNDGSGEFGFNKGKHFDRCDPDSTTYEFCQDMEPIGRFRYILEYWDLI